MISRRSAAYPSMIRRATSKRVSFEGGSSLPGHGSSGGGFMPQRSAGTTKGPLR